MQPDKRHSPSRFWSYETNRWLSLAIVLVFYYAAARLGLLLAFESTNASPIWPPTGIAFAAVILYGTRIWPAITVGAFLANFAVFSANHVAADATTIITSSVIAVGNTLEALVGAFLLRVLIRGEILFNQPGQIFKFCFTVIVMCMVSALIGTHTVIIANLAPVAARNDIFLNWWLGDVGGALLIMPALLCWLRPQQYASSKRSIFEIIFSLVVLFGIAALVFSGRFVVLPTERLLLILCFLAEAWAAYRFGRRGVTLTALILAITAVIGTVNRVGPFTAGPLNDSLILLISFIALTSVSGLLLAADIAERDELLGKESTGWRELVSSWSALLAALSLTVIAWHLMSSDTERRASDQLHRWAREIQLRINKRLTDIESILRGGQALFAASSTVDRDEWKAYINKLEIDEYFPGILAIGYAPVISTDNLENFIGDIRRAGVTDFRVWPSPQQPFATPILYIEPAIERNQRALGFNMSSEASRRDTMAMARDSGKPVITRNVKLVQDDNVRRAGALIYLPIYRNGAADKSIDERRTALAGYVYGAFRIGDLVEAAIFHQNNALRLEVFDGAEPHADLLMYSNHSSMTNPAAYRDSKALTETVELHTGQRTWLLRFTALPEFEKGVDRQKAQLILIAGSVISLLLFTLMRSLALTTRQALRMADTINMALRDSEERLRLLIDGVKDCAIYMLDPTGHVISWNSGAEQIKGYRAQEILGKHFSKFYSVADIARQHPQEVLRIATETAHFHEEGWRVRKDGSLFWAEVNISALRDESGNLRGFSKVTRDLSARKQAEDALYAVSQRLSLATQAAGIGVWEWDVKNNLLSWDEQMYALYQIDAETASNDYEMWRSRVSKNDIERAEQELQQAIDTRSRFISEFHIVLPGGETRIISAIGACFVDENGELENMVGVNWDITAMRRTQNALQASEERFRSALEHAPIGMAVVALDGTWLEVNRAICDIVGYDRHEMSRLTFQDITHPDDLGSDLAQVQQLLAGDIHTYRMEKRYISKQQQTVWANLTVSLVRDSQQRPLYFIAQIEDSTHRKQQDHQIRVALAEKEMLLKEVYHRVKNNLQVIISLFNLQVNTLADGVAKNALRESAERVRAMALVHEKLYESSNLASLPVIEYISGLCRQIEMSHTVNRRVAIECDIDPIELGMDMAIPLGLLLNELISNCIKHAFASDQPGHITVSLKYSGEFQVELLVVDNGVGLPLDFDSKRSKSLGVKLSHALAKQLGGSIEFNRQSQGTQVRVRFALSTAAPVAQPISASA